MAGLFDLFSFGQDAPGGGLLGRINNPLTLAGLGVLAGRDASSGFEQGLQGFMYGSKQQQEMMKQAQMRQALQQYAGGGDIKPLLLSGDPQLMQTALQLQSQKQATERDARDFAFRQDEARRTQANADRAFGLQSQTAARSDPATRAQVAAQYGIKPGTPEFNTYVLNGELPTSSANVDAQVSQRRQAAEAIGLKPDNPAYQGYILTGKMPREDAQPLSATDKKAIQEADEMVLTNQTGIDALRQAKDLSTKAFSGPLAGSRGYAASFLGESSDIGKSGVATTDLNNLVTSNALTQLKSIFGSAPTEGERKILLDIQGSVNQPDVIRQKIYDRAIALAEKRLEFNRKRADELRGGQFYKPQGGQKTTAPTSPSAEIPAGAIAALKANPSLKDEFEAKYGAGSASVALR